MLGQLVQDVGGWGDGIRAEIQFQSGLLGSGNETVGCGLVAGDVHIASGPLVFRLDAIGVGHAAVGVGSIVISSLNHLHVPVGHTGFLGKFLMEHIADEIQVAVEKPAHQSERKHVAALEHHFRWCVGGFLGSQQLHHLGDGAGHDAEHQSEDIELIMTDMLLRFRTKLMSIPAKQSPILAEKTDQKAIFKILKTAIDEALDELADFDTAFGESEDEEE